MTKSYHEIESTTYDSVRQKTLSRIHGKPSWRQKEDLIQEAGDIALECDVSYDWAGDYGLLAVISGPTRYLAQATLAYVEPVQPVTARPNNVTTAVQINTWETENDLQRRTYAVFRGFKRGICENVRDALDQQYYQQIKEVTFSYKRRTSRNCIDHLEQHWCMLDCKTIEKLKLEWK